MTRTPEVARAPSSAPSRDRVLSLSALALLAAAGPAATAPVRTLAPLDATDRDAAPQLLQVLPVGDAPEGLLAIPSRGLFVTSNEDDGSLSVFGLR